jgi:glycosyltransferase involved in cell wall biosynthesis
MEDSQISNIDNSGNVLVTIITVVLNQKENLEKTIQSVISQTYKNIEYIVIDGGSTDGTLDVIKKYQHAIYAWISEPDTGIYDAMNKGIDLATGRFINFMNAGDVLYEDRALEKVFQGHPKDCDLIYSDCEIVYDHDRRLIRKAGSAIELWRGMFCSHQSIFVRSDLLKKYKFDVNVKIAADFKFIFNLYLKGYRFYNSKATISSVAADGFSGKYCGVEAVVDRWNVVRKYKNNLKVNLYYCLLIMYKLAVALLGKVLPKAVFHSLIKFRFSITNRI